ncbi:MAG: SWIB/MDM2 domain-containing protein [Candidatus Dojkabacteria bacterium]
MDENKTAAPAKKAAGGLAKPMNLSAELQEIVGAGPMPRTEVTKKLWVYIKANNLQNPENKREIMPDAKLGKVLGNNPINMFAMTKVVSQHLS